MAFDVVQVAGPFSFAEAVGVSEHTPAAAYAGDGVVLG